jgi:peptidoglycan/xylan/chitin deacetylase (PgdA/CDA1 family)
MFFHGDIRGDRLPAGTLCFTYDDGPAQVSGRGDGPGPRTVELAEYLADAGVPATFFVVGQFARESPEILTRLDRCGHLVGNHTDSHPGLVGLVRQGGDAVGELAAADRVIQERAPRPLTFFRAPYGNWRETVGPEHREDRPTSIVAAELNESPLARTYVGPINWDISGHDYDYWRQGRPAEECAREYLDRIGRAGRGIVLLHDSSDDPAIRASNRTFEVTRILVPRLKEQGYRFVRLDDVPQVRSAARVTRLVAWRAEDGRFLGIDAAGGVRAATTSVGPQEQFGLVELGEDRVAIRARNGAFLSIDPDSGVVTARADAIGPEEEFRRLDLGGRVSLQAAGSAPGEPGSSYIELGLSSTH